MLDRLGRPLTNLRLSVTDRCNLRCAYCMPEEHYTWFERERLLSFEEVTRLVGIFCRLGVRKVRLTGGEPLLRRDLPVLVRMLAGLPELQEIALTTNGVRLPEEIDSLVASGLRRVTVSLDTLDAGRFERLTRRRDHARVLEGIRAATRSGLPTKLDTVLLRDGNHDEIIALLDFARSVGAELRFIEYMDVGGATRWTWREVVSRREILAVLEAHEGPIEPLPREDAAPAERYRLRDGTVFGIIASTTEPFCATCDRSRLTADGQWFRCLYAREGSDLKTPLRTGESDEEIEARLRHLWAHRTDQGAVERLALRRERTHLAAPEELVRNPHLEMHRRGG